MKVSPSEVLDLVKLFGARYGEMKSVLWCLSTKARRFLLHGERLEVIEALVWTLRSWWGVQGLSRADGHGAARALFAVHCGTPNACCESWAFPAARSRRPSQAPG